MGCKNSKIVPERKVISIFEIISRLESDIFNYKYNKHNSYEEDMLVITIKESIINANKFIDNSYMGEDIKKWFKSKVKLYEVAIASENNIKKKVDFNISTELENAK